MEEIIAHRVTPIIKCMVLFLLIFTAKVLTSRPHETQDESRNSIHHVGNKPAHYVRTFTKYHHRRTIQWNGPQETDWPLTQDHPKVIQKRSVDIPNSSDFLGNAMGIPILNQFAPDAGKDNIIGPIDKNPVMSKESLGKNGLGSEPKKYKMKAASVMKEPTTTVGPTISCLYKIHSVALSVTPSYDEDSNAQQVVENDHFDSPGVISEVTLPSGLVAQVEQCTYPVTSCYTLWHRNVDGNMTVLGQGMHWYIVRQGQKVKDTSDWGRHFATREDRLHLLLTKLEERLATRVSPEPAINLVLYAQPCHTAPLKIYDHQDKPLDLSVQAFMSPKWGGVVLASPGATDCRGRQVRAAWAPPVRAVMGTFLAQLRPLLGIVETEPIEHVYLEPLRSVTPRRWEVDTLLRIRTLEQLTSAELTLQSLAQLLGEISNIVINDKVGDSISSAVEGIEIASTLLRHGELEGAYHESLDAYQAAEAAFTDPSLLALLYFPDDQKYAIYIPLFLPIMFPVILSIKTLLLWLRGKSTKEKTE